MQLSVSHFHRGFKSQSVANRIVFTGFRRGVRWFYEESYRPCNTCRRHVFNLSFVHLPSPWIIISGLSARVTSTSTMCAGRYSIFSTALIALFAYGLVLHEHAQLINSFLPRISFLNEPSSSREIDFFF